MPSRSYIWKMRFEMDSDVSVEVSKNGNCESKPKQTDAKQTDAKKTQKNKNVAKKTQKQKNPEARMKKCTICKKGFPDCDLTTHWLGPHAKPKTVRYCTRCEAN